MIKETTIDLEADTLTAVFYDDQISTIEEHVKIVKDRGIRPVIPQSVPDLYEAIKRLGDTAVYFLDMHVPDVSDLGAIDIPRISTRSGSAFGTAVYKAVTETTSLKLNHAHILSGRTIDMEAMQILSELEDDGLIVEEVDKEDIPFFIERVEKYKRDSSVDIGPAGDKTSDDYENNLYHVEVEAIRKIFADFVDDPDELTAASLGLAMKKGGDFSDILAHVRNGLELQSADVRARIDFVLHIKKCISRAFGERNGSIQKVWMNSPIHMLGDRSPIDVIRSRDINDVAMLAAAVDRAVI